MGRVSEQAPTSPTSVSGAAILVAALLDVFFVIAFAALGRAEHGGTIQLAALWQAAWPFLFALAVMWVACRVWRRPRAALSSGLPIWIGTLTIGMVLRVIFTAGGAALPFVLVACGVLGVTLVGWRLIAVAFTRTK